MAIVERDKGKRKVLDRLRNKYQLVIRNERTYEERLSFRLSRMNVLLISAAALALTCLLFLAILIFTPLKRYIPGYADDDIRINAYHSMLMADSLKEELNRNTLYLNNLQRILSDKVGNDSLPIQERLNTLPSGEELAASPAMRDLRERLAQERAAGLISDDEKGAVVQGLDRTVLFTPLRGMVTSTFDLQAGHFGIDVVSPNEDAVKCVMEGTVIMASWTYDFGYVIGIQHGNDLISIYKHNAVLLKKIGDKVSGGEAIAIVGNTGELSDGPHLHFELWSKGRPIDPQEHLVFG